MTTFTLPEVAPVEKERARRVPISPVSFRRVAASEWVKLTTLRSTWIVFSCAFAGMVSFGVLTSWAVTSQSLPVGFSALSQSLSGFHLAELAIIVVGVLTISGEYATGLIRSTMSSEPKRLPVLWAKLAVFSAVTMVTMIVAAFISFFAARAVMGSHGTTIGAPNALQSVFGVGLYLVVVGALAMGLGFLTRSTAGGIASAFAIMLLLPELAQLLPSSWQSHILPYLPSYAGRELIGPHTLGRFGLGPWAGFGVMCVWGAVAIVGGGYRLMRQDV